ncbi:MAG: universal stress protein [Spirochaetes bacterium]|jgi:nucleotide-binding universal stress UspA family protein|nr:universal stress protein [Spirochaetota bacterium]
MLSIKTILHPTDFSTGARQALAYAIAMARRHQSSLHVLHVAGHGNRDTDLGRDASGASTAHDAKDVLEDVQPAQDEDPIAKMIQEAGATDLAVTIVHQRGPAPGPRIIDYAKEQNADLVLMGTHGRRGMKRMLLGSVAEEVVHEAECSVMTVREKREAPAQPSIDRVLVPVDLSEFSAPLFRAALDVARVHGAGVDLLHVVEPLPYPRPLVGQISVHDLVPDPTERSGELLSELVSAHAQADVYVTTHTAEGHAAQTIVQHADALESDLIIMASQGMSAIERLLLGSVTARVVRRAQCPVFIARVQPEPFPA